MESLESDQQPQASDSKSIKDVVMESLQLMKAAINVFLVQRPGYRRAYILILIFTYAIMISLSIGSGAVLGTNVFNRPLSWTASQFSYWSSVGFLTAMFGNIFGAILLKKVFHFKVSQQYCHPMPKQLTIAVGSAPRPRAASPQVRSLGHRPQTPVGVPPHTPLGLRPQTPGGAPPQTPSGAPPQTPS